MSARIERQPLPISEPPALDAGRPELVEVIRAEIARTGPVTFARFMELALYEPRYGYYSATDAHATRAGDFLTAPELHPIFGWTVARQLHEMWTRLGEPGRFTLREYGAGTGSLGEQIRQGLVRDGSGLARAMRYEPVETVTRSQFTPSEDPTVGCIVGNEFLDALPVHRVINDRGLLREIYVDWRDDGFVEVMGPVSDDRIGRRVVAGELQPAQRAEVSLAIPAWLSRVRDQLERGYILLFDYGLSRAELRSAERMNGTIRAFRGQHVASDVLAGVGNQDLTAHIDLDALDDDAQDAGVQPLGRTTQARFLLSCGLEEVFADVKQEADAEMESALLLRSAVRRLLDPRQYGGYAVVALGVNAAGEPPLRGFA